MSSNSSKQAKDAILAFLTERATDVEHFYASTIIRTTKIAEDEVKRSLTALVKDGSLHAVLESRCAHCHRIASETIRSDGDLLDCPFCGETPHRQFVSFAVTPRGEKKIGKPRPKAARRKAPLSQTLWGLLRSIRLHPQIQN